MVVLEGETHGSVSYRLGTTQWRLRPRVPS